MVTRLLPPQENSAQIMCSYGHNSLVIRMWWSQVFQLLPYHQPVRRAENRTAICELIV